MLLAVAGLVLAGVVAGVWLGHELERRGRGRARVLSDTGRLDLRRRAEWLAFARIYELRASADPLVLRGSLEGADLLAYADGIGGPRCFLQLVARLDVSLGLDLRVRERRTIDFVRSLRQTTGNPVFDEHFVVRTSRPAEAIHVLDDAALEEIVSLRSMGLNVSLSDRLLVVRSSSAEADVTAFPAIARRCRALADRIVLRSLHVEAPTEGPYR